MSDPGFLTSYRQALMAVFANDLGIRFVPGMLVGPIQHTDLGSVYVRAFAEMPSRIEEAHYTAIVRVFKALQEPKDPQTPYDPTPLEQLHDQLLISMRNHQTGLGPWMQRITGIQIDPITQGIEATILATAGNPGLIPT